MKIKAFTNRKFLGEFDFSEIAEQCGLIAVGTLVKLGQVKYCISNVAVNNEGNILLEVN